jgi:exodeoxyribonuclease VII small subunit
MAKKQESDFEAKLKEFNEIIEHLDSGEHNLEKMIVYYERGMNLATELKEFLAIAEQKIIDITKKYSKE